MLTKETEDFFEKMLTEEKDIENAYIDALSDWDKGLFKIQLPSLIARHKKTTATEIQNTNKQQTR